MEIRRFYALAFVLGMTAFATLQAQILVGPILGGGVSWLAYHEKESRAFYNQTPVPGFLAGADVSFQVRKRFYMHTALIYNIKGKNLSSDQSPDLKQKEVDRYIDMPILFTHEFTVKMGRFKEVKWYGGLGPNISYWLGGKGSLNTSQLLEDGLPSIHYRVGFHGPDPNAPDVVAINQPNRVQLGLNLCVGAVFEPMGYQKINVNLRFEVGNTYLAKGGPTTFPGVNDYSDDVKARNMGVRLSASYLIDLKTSERKKGRSTVDKHVRKKK